MLHEEDLSIDFDDIDIELYDDNDPTDIVEDFKFSDSVFDNDNTELLSMLDEYTATPNNDQVFDRPQDPVFPTDVLAVIPGTQMDNRAIVDDSHIDENDLEQNFDYDLYQETVVQQSMSPPVERIDNSNNENLFESITDGMVVKVQPKPDQRARYGSDGLRFLPDSRKNPMAIQLPDLSSQSCSENETYGVILTMVTSEHNPKRQTFVHVNDTKYDTDDAIELDEGGIFLPITEMEKKNREKKFPRYSVTCKKFDQYTFELKSFNPSNENSIIEKYILPNEDSITKAAKGKQFVIDYDLLCYKIIFQLVFKRDNQFFISNITCETNIINEQKAPPTGIKRKASSTTKIPGKQTGSMNLPIVNASKKSKSSVPSSTERLLIRRSNRITKRSKRSSVGSS